MGCSASRPSVTVITNRGLENHNQITTSESSNSSSPNQNPNPNHQKAFSLTTPLIHHPPSKKGDTHHLVSLTSTTYGYGSLLISKTPSLQPPKNDTKPITPPPNDDKTHQPNQPQYSLSPDSVINTWELMHGLNDDDDDDDDYFDLTNHNRRIKPESCRYPSLDEFNYTSFSSHASSSSSSSTSSSSSSSSTTTTKPLWKHLSEESLLSKMDPNVGLTYRRALSSRQLGYKHSKTRSLGSTPLSASSASSDRIVVYFTSLRGIRKTYEDCCAVRGILRGFRVWVDERDVSMDSELRRELQGAMPAGAARLPQVFIRGRHVGGVEEIKRMNEAGDLAQLLDGFPTLGPGVVVPCGACADVRFVPCRGCCGSRKVFVHAVGELRRCRDCNENGLIRCPICCS